jgi:hypothetical protein
VRPRRVVLQQPTQPTPWLTISPLHEAAVGFTSELAPVLREQH